MRSSDDDLPAGLRAAASFACAFVGWSLGIVWYVGSCVLGGGFGYVTDFDAIAFWSACFVALVWLVVMLPLALRVEEQGALARAAVAPAFGAVLGFACFAALLLPLGGLELAGEPLFALHAALVGASAWGLFALGLRRPASLARRPALALAALVAGPLVAVLTFAFALWPATERLAPAFAYRFGSTDARQRLYERAIRELQVGDSIEDLRARLPGEFELPTTATSGQIGARTQYRIRFDGERVAEVEVFER